MMQEENKSGEDAERMTGKQVIVLILCAIFLLVATCNRFRLVVEPVVRPIESAPTTAAPVN